MKYEGESYFWHEGQAEDCKRAFVLELMSVFFLRLDKNYKGEAFLSLDGYIYQEIRCLNLPTLWSSY